MPAPTVPVSPSAPQAGAASVAPPRLDRRRAPGLAAGAGTDAAAALGESAATSAWLGRSESAGHVSALPRGIASMQSATSAASRPHFATSAASRPPGLALSRGTGSMFSTVSAAPGLAASGGRPGPRPEVGPGRGLSVRVLFLARGARESAAVADPANTRMFCGKTLTVLSATPSTCTCHRRVSSLKHTSVPRRPFISPNFLRP